MAEPHTHKHKHTQAHMRVHTHTLTAPSPTQRTQNSRQRRLARHEDAALAKYYELDRRLRNDPRLALLLVPA